MRDLAPEITRQRLLIEGHYSISVDREVVAVFLRSVAKHLELETYDDPVIFSPGGSGKPENQGFDAFIPLIDSGISLYVWENQQFFSTLLYTCKSFDESEAISYAKSFFGSAEVVHHSF